MLIAFRWSSRRNSKKVYCKFSKLNNVKRKTVKKQEELEIVRFAKYLRRKIHYEKLSSGHSDFINNEWMELSASKKVNFNNYLHHVCDDKETTSIVCMQHVQLLIAIFWGDINWITPMDISSERSRQNTNISQAAAATLVYETYKQLPI